MSMNPIKHTQSGPVAQALFLPCRSVFKLGDLVNRLVSSKAEESTKAPEGEKETAETEKPKPSGIPIDQAVPKTRPVPTAASEAERKQGILQAALEKVTQAEKAVLDRFGGTIMEMDKVPGCEGKEYKNTVFVNTPKNPEKFVDKDGKPVPPRIVYYFHGNGGKIGDDARAIMDQVERMRAQGDNVILVMPQDNKGHWRDLENPEAFKDMQKMVETMMGGKPIRNISISSFSGGYVGVAKVLKNLRENAASDPESQKLYKNIRQLGFLDSAYGGAEEFAEWAKDKNHTLFSNYTAKCESGNRLLEDAIRRARSGDMEGIRISGFNGIHGNAPLAFMEAMRREATAGMPEEEKSAPEQIGRDEFLKGLAECRTAEERQRYIISLVARNGLSKDCLEERIYETEVNGRKVQVSMTGLLAVGAPGKSVTLGLDAYTSQAIADMMGGRLPTAKFHRRLYVDDKVQKVPFFTGEELESRVNARRKEQGLPPLNINTVTVENGRQVTKRNGIAMESADYMLAESEQLDEWLRQHNISRRTIMVGGRKVVLAPEGSADMLTFGGGLYTDTKRDPATGEILEVNVSNRMVQGIGDRAHPPIFHDYASGTEIALGLVINGRTVKFDEIRDNDEYKNYRPIVAELFGPSMDNRYKTPSWMDEYVARYKKNEPRGTESAPSRIAESVKEPEKAVTPTPEIPSSPQPSVPQKTTSVSGSIPSGPVPVPEYAPSKQTGEPVKGYASYESPPVSQPSAKEVPIETKETYVGKKTYILGDSLSMGFAGFLNDVNGKHINTVSETDSTGAHTGLMLTALNNKILNQNVEGTTLVIVGGTNDIFNPDSLRQIKDNLSKIYFNAKKAEMKVVAATLPPLAHSNYSKMNWERVRKNPAFKNRYSSYEDYNADLISRWNELNRWIISQKGLNTEKEKGPDEVVEFHKVLENPDLPGSLTKDNYGEGGIHLKDYSVMGKALNAAVRRLNASEKPAGSGYTVKSESSSGVTPLELTDENRRMPLNAADNPFLAQNAEIRKRLPDYIGLRVQLENLGSFANELRASKDFGSIIHFTDGQGNEYVAIKEWHPPYDSRNPTKPQSWHQGISVLQKKSA